MARRLPRRAAHIAPPVIIPHSDRKMEMGPMARRVSALLSRAALRLGWAGWLLLTAVRPWATVEPSAWDSRFFLPGINGEVRALARSGNELYVTPWNEDVS